MWYNRLLIEFGINLLFGMATSFTVGDIIMPGLIEAYLCRAHQIVVLEYPAQPIADWSISHLSSPTIRTKTL
jgi:hypothetical protein